MTRQEYIGMLDEAVKITIECGFGERTVHPYGYPEKVNTMLTRCYEYDRYTASSKSILALELKGLYDILKHWEKDFKSRRMVRVNGKVKNLTAEFIEMLIEEGVEVEYI